MGRASRKNRKLNRDKDDYRRVSELDGGLSLATKERHFEFFAIAVLFCLGLYHSIIYFGHQVVPNSDFPCFAQTARELLSFQLPSSFKRAPVLGFLQVALSSIVGGQHPDLTAGRLLSAGLHPFNLVLLYLVSRRIIGKAALWITLIIGINPWLIREMRQPIADTTLLFFVLLTFFFLFRRSKWRYLFASVTTMVRYEGVVLILIAFMMDMIEAHGTKDRIRAFVYSGLAAIPLALWMLGTIMNLQSDDGHYLKELGSMGGVVETTKIFINKLWRMGFAPLFTPLASFKKIGTLAITLNKFTVATGFIFGAAYGFYKRQWNIIALLIFFLLYMTIHIIHSFAYDRFCTTVSWITVLVCFYGLKCIWDLIDHGGRLPPLIKTALQGIVLVIAVAWLV